MVVGAEALGQETASLVKQFSSWLNGIDYELEFWSKFMGSRGGDWPEDFNRRLETNGLLEEWIVSGMQIDTSRPLEILDVGAGPLTVLGKIHDGRPLDITAVDPLAPFYSELAIRFSVNRPVETQQAFAEDLTSYFQPSSFDLTHCCNALDHSFDPIRGIEEMIAVTRIGGRIVLRHNLNEGEAEGYKGFHQWNFNAKDGHFIIWNKQSTIDVNEHVNEYATVSVIRSEDFCVVLITKVKDVPFDLAARSRVRVQDLYSATLFSIVEQARARSEASGPAQA